MKAFPVGKFPTNEWSRKMPAMGKSHGSSFKYHPAQNSVRKTQNSLSQVNSFSSKAGSNSSWGRVREAITGYTKKNDSTLCFAAPAVHQLAYFLINWLIFLRFFPSLRLQ